MASSSWVAAATTLGAVRARRRWRRRLSLFLVGHSESSQALPEWRAVVVTGRPEATALRQPASLQPQPIALWRAHRSKPMRTMKLGAKGANIIATLSGERLRRGRRVHRWEGAR
jgi:hypothetical protein